MRKHFVLLTALIVIIFSAIVATPVLAAGEVPSPSTAKKAVKKGTTSQKPAAQASDKQPQPATGTESVGQEQTVTTLQLSAVVPVEFKQTILVNFISGDKENIMARLDSPNGYLYSEEDIKPGTYKVDFINIVGENATDYNIEASHQVVVKEGTVTKFTMQLALKPTAKKQNIPSEKQTKEPTEESMERLLNGTNESGSVTTNDTQVSTEENITEPVAATKPAETPSKPKFTIDPTKLKMIIWGGIIAVLALLVFLYKKLSYKHDYYDC
ncbi:hypothetical protein [Paenibacillus brasilensis]|uniref:Uncharacterized protein n=1 Tax=Paenibacillus brasilensis TaxID=128574 RepID=A0ABU0L6L0_9BACL|nr:hypothetical protein [Paenibacillus brasilensis]MDQ0496865.1 hypothetical protein [Paenibacillus brasilensis]